MLLLGFTIGIGERAYDAFGFEYLRGDYAHLAHQKDMQALRALSLFKGEDGGGARACDLDAPQAYFPFVKGVDVCFPNGFVAASGGEIELAHPNENLDRGLQVFELLQIRL